MDKLTKKQKQIFANIRKLEVELKAETIALAKEGYTIKSEYNKATNKDNLIIKKENKQ
jgi:hypothetical protein